MSPRRRFTLLDLLVGTGIVALLCGIILSAVPATWERANQLRCQSNIRKLTAAFLAFAHDHGEHLPGSGNRHGKDPNPDHWDWLFGPYSASGLQPGDPGLNVTPEQRLACAPQSGTIWKYVSNDCDPMNPSPSALRIYRCPSLTIDDAGRGKASNGRFDYAAFSCFSGALIADINPVSELDCPSHIELHPTPLICQQDARYSTNPILDGQHWRLDRISHLHNGASWYGGVDGGLYQVNEPDNDVVNSTPGGTSLWWQVKPNGKQAVSLDGDPVWDGWSGR